MTEEAAKTRTSRKSEKTQRGEEFEQREGRNTAACFFQAAPAGNKEEMSDVDKKIKSINVLMLLSLLLLTIIIRICSTVNLHWDAAPRERSRRAANPPAWLKRRSATGSPAFQPRRHFWRRTMWRD